MKSMKIADLRQECVKRCISFDKKAKKSELIRLLSLFEKEEENSPPVKKAIVFGMNAFPNEELSFSEDIQYSPYSEEHTAAIANPDVIIFLALPPSLEKVEGIMEHNQKGECWIISRKSEDDMLHFSIEEIVQKKNFYKDRTVFLLLKERKIELNVFLWKDVQSPSRDYSSEKYTFLSSDIPKIKKGLSQKRNEISYSEFCEEIRKKEFAEEFTSSLKKLLAFKLKFYNEKIQEITKEREKIKRKIDIITQQKGVSPSIIKEKYPFYDFYCCLIADIEILGKDMFRRLENMDVESVAKSLESAIYNKEKGLTSLIGREYIKDIICEHLYSFSKSYLVFTNSFTNFALIGNSGIGKCLGKDTPILLFNGDVCLVQDISVGMQLMGDDSLPRNVLSITCGKEELYRICQKTAEDYIVNKSHILTLMTCNYDIIDISVRDLLQIEKWEDKFLGFGTSVDFPCAENIIHPCVYSKKYGIFLFQKGNKYMRKATYSSIPKYYKTEPLRLFFLEGILSFFQKTEDKKYILPMALRITYHPEFIKDIMYIARSVGFHAYISTMHKDLHIYSSDMCIPHDNGFFTLRKIEIQPLGEGDYFGFEIDGNRRFLLEDFTVTHNTHIAKVISYVYNTVGILSTGDVKIVSRYDLVGSYVGQTSPKTQSLLFQTLEGVLFIDEAYQLAPEKTDNDYGGEAITEIVNFTDKYMGMSIVIVAGYKDLMLQRFFKSNEGLLRRFPIVVTLDDYTPEELCDILLSMLHKKRVFIPHSLKNYIYTLIHNTLLVHPQLFSNQGGDMLNLASFIEKSILSSYKVKWINGDLENNRFIIKEGFSRFLEIKGFHFA